MGRRASPAEVRLLPRLSLPSRGLLGGLLGLLLTACADAPGAPADAALDGGPRPDDLFDLPLAGATVTLGTGRSAWDDLAAGATVAPTRGPQGGLHLFARVRATGLSPDLYVSFRVVDLRSAEVLSIVGPPLRRALGSGLERSGAGLQSSNAELCIFLQTDPALLAGRHVRFEVAVREVGGALRGGRDGRDLLLSAGP